ncbi:thiamine phosphate synthase [Streptomyces sp. SL13]|uniref:Thiamine-phosphate synthase n=1 Tax=Streptantibioticus silvisoli TaxID=2705255 RepID=A0AA90H7I2_9ACTN|nr:thiamine phosphate synthase [Streptantibioticus silvisoli]MDI5970235.1 thiamine phosphate synthase [Streptantibioticus silvisoli]
MTRTTDGRPTGPAVSAVPAPERPGGAPAPAGRAAALRARLAGARLYLCTDARKRQGDLPAFLDAVLGGGVDVVQLRDKTLEAAEELDHLAVLADACRRHGALLAVNDRADVAHAAGADILHLGQGDLPVPAARALVGDEMLIGRSCHAESEAAAAAADPGADYFCTGPVWPTPTKPGRHAPGLPLVRYAAGLGTGRPWFAIGGIDPANLGEVLAAGARRVVVVRALTEAPDPAAAATRLAAAVRAVPLSGE